MDKMEVPIRTIRLIFLLCTVLLLPKTGAAIIVNIGYLHMVDAIWVSNSPLPWAFLSLYVEDAPFGTKPVRSLTYADKLFEFTLTFYPRDENALWGKARVLAFLGLMDEAVANYRLILNNKVDSRNRLQMMEAAQLSAVQKDFSNAVYLWQQIGNAYGPYHAGFYYWDRECWSLAEKEFLLAVMVQPDDAILQHYLCRALHQQSDLRAAIVYCDNAVRLDPDKGPYHIYYANLLAESGNIDNAVDEARIAVLIMDDAFSYSTLGKVLLEKRDFIGARTALEQSLELMPTAGTYYLIGVTYQKEGLVDRAIQVMKKSLEIDPGYEPALRAIDQLET